VRVLFSCPENIAMSQFRRHFIHTFPERMAADGREAPVDWVQGGYLFIVPPRAMGLLESNYERQRAHGCDVEMLAPQQLKERFPSMAVDDFGGGVHSPGDGWCDPNGLLQGFRRKAASLGAEYITDRVVGLTRSGHGVGRAARVRRDAAGRSIRQRDRPRGGRGLRDGRHAAAGRAAAPLRALLHGRFADRAAAVRQGLDRLAFRSEGAGFSAGWSTATSRAGSTSRSATATSSRSSGRRSPIALRPSRPRAATGRGRACTNNASSTATRSSATGRAGSKTSGSSAASRATG
jgi:hypothetical protein